jgi:hypothetical protein
MNAETYLQEGVYFLMDTADPKQTSSALVISIDIDTDIETNANIAATSAYLI